MELNACILEDGPIGRRQPVVKRPRNGLSPFICLKLEILIRIAKGDPLELGVEADRNIEIPVVDLYLHEQMRQQNDGQEL